jgi:hypothetical protein
MHRPNTVIATALPYEQMGILKKRVLPPPYSVPYLA